jgi:hypothetical protein
MSLRRNSLTTGAAAAVLALDILTGGIPGPVHRHSAAIEASCDSTLALDTGKFARSTTIDNKWLPLAPGTQLVFEGRSVQDDKPVAHRVMFTVTDLAKVINGVPTRVIWDQDFGDGKVLETELAFFAQDDDGNVWSLGEYPEEYEDGKFSGAPNTWIAGQEDATAGIAMPANPQAGTPSYTQGSAPDIDFLDCGKVVQTGQRTCVPAGCYNDVVVIDETSPLDPDGGTQRKHHAPGVGVVQIGAVNDPEPETLALVEVVRLDAAAMQRARENARTLDKRAYEMSDIYRKTPPLQGP